MPLLVFLHGATQNGAEDAPAHRRGGRSDWALPSSHRIRATARGTRIRDEFDEDVVFLNRALEYVFERLDVDPARLAIGGFSDGASYGLSLGLVNGDLFPRVVACSPGFIIQAPSHGRPHLFFSHGTSDQVLPINQCSRVMVPRLRSMGYDVTFKRIRRTARTAA